MEATKMNWFTVVKLKPEDRNLPQRAETLMKRSLIVLADDAYDKQTDKDYQKTLRQLLEFGKSFDELVDAWPPYQSPATAAQQHIGNWIKRYYKDGGEMVSYYLRRLSLEKKLRSKLRPRKGYQTPKEGPSISLAELRRELISVTTQYFKDVEEMIDEIQKSYNLYVEEKKRWELRSLKRRVHSPVEFPEGTIHNNPSRLIKNIWRTLIFGLEEAKPKAFRRTEMSDRHGYDYSTRPHPKKHGKGEEEKRSRTEPSTAFKDRSDQEAGSERDKHAEWYTLSVDITKDKGARQVIAGDTKQHRWSGIQPIHNSMITGMNGLFRDPILNGGSYTEHEWGKQQSPGPAWKQRKRRTYAKIKGKLYEANQKLPHVVLEKIKEMSKSKQSNLKTTLTDKGKTGREHPEQKESDPETIDYGAKPIGGGKQLSGRGEKWQEKLEATTPEKESEALDNPWVIELVNKQEFGFKKNPENKLGDEVIEKGEEQLLRIENYILVTYNDKVVWSRGIEYGWYLSADVSQMLTGTDADAPNILNVTWLNGFLQGQCKRQANDTLDWRMELP